MIVSAYESDNDIVFITNGCGCCSSNLYKESDKDDIILELKRNIEVTKEACNLMGIDIKDLL